MKSKYRFITEDEFKKPCHRHQLLVDDKWVDATGGSTIVDVLGKTLTWWASSMAVAKLGWLSPKHFSQEERIGAASSSRSKIEVMNNQEYLNLLDEAYKAHSVRLEDSAKAGTDMHGELESYVKGCIHNNDSKPIEIKEDRNKYIVDFSAFACQHIKRFLWSEGYCYHEKLFVGGISDVGAEMMDGSYAIIDFKSSKEAYFGHFVQVAIYNLLIENSGIVNKEGKKVLKLDRPISKYFIIPFGAKEFTVYENANVDELKSAAKACIELYRAKSHFEEK